MLTVPVFLDTLVLPESSCSFDWGSGAVGPEPKRDEFVLLLVLHLTGAVACSAHQLGESALKFAFYYEVVCAPPENVNYLCGGYQPMD